MWDVETGRPLHGSPCGPTTVLVAQCAHRNPHLVVTAGCNTVQVLLQHTCPQPPCRIHYACCSLFCTPHTASVHTPYSLCTHSQTQGITTYLAHALAQVWTHHAGVLQCRPAALPGLIREAQCLWLTPDDSLALVGTRSGDVLFVGVEEGKLLGKLPEGRGLPGGITAIAQGPMPGDDDD